MGTTAYFEQAIAAIGDDDKPDPGHRHVLAVGIGTFTGKEELYLSMSAGDSEEHCAPVVFLDRDAARELRDALDQAMRDLHYF
jgi:hypothetical protein